jgi:DNA-binding XRE family transcriptional regulator
MDEPRKSSRFKYPQVTEVAALLVPAPYQLPWFYEAPVRHWLRTMLVLQGMAWSRADWIGHSLVARARIENGVRQPEGWDSDNELAQWMPDTECPICDKPFNRRWLEQYYCSTACSRRGAEIRLWCEARVGVIEPPRCGFCHAHFDAYFPQQKFCTKSCQDKAGKLDASERADVELGKSIANARRNARWTQEHLAHLVGIHPRYLGSIEEGKAGAGTASGAKRRYRPSATREQSTARGNVPPIGTMTKSCAASTSTCPTDPLPMLDPTDPAVLPVLELIKLELALLRIEQANLTTGRRCSWRVAGTPRPWPRLSTRPKRESMDCW